MIRKIIRKIRYGWLYVLAWLHLSDYAVCEMSKSRGDHDDFHDYTDSAMFPWHMEAHYCMRCNKRFFI